MLVSVRRTLLLDVRAHPPLFAWLEQRRERDRALQREQHREREVVAPPGRAAEGAGSEKHRFVGYAGARGNASERPFLESCDHPDYILVPMRRRSLLSRLLVSAIAIMQMAAPALAVVADARLVAGSDGAAQVHVEDHTQKSCRPVHPDDCALCQLLTHFSAPRASAPALPAGTSALWAIRTSASLRPASVIRAQERTRAPPVSLS